MQDQVLQAALAALKAGTLDELLRRRPLATRWFARRLLGPVQAVAGDALPPEPAHAAAWLLLLRATLARLRPDGAPTLQWPISTQDWLERNAWRPWLALACHCGLLAVPAFAERYRPRAGEPAAEVLCGLWDVAASTYYRHLDKGKALLAEALFEPPPAGAASLQRWALLQQETHALLGQHDVPARQAWHARQAQRALGRRQGTAALWHLAGAGDDAGFVACVQRLAVDLADAAETDALVQQFAASLPDGPLRFELCLAVAGLWRLRGNDDAELQAHEQALRWATGADDKLRLGIAYGALGKFHESRDADRAFSCYQESADFLRQAGLPDADGADAAEVLPAYITTLVKLAWLYVLRNDPRCKAVLEQAEALRAHGPQPPELLAMLEQAWGEYWRRAGELPRALEHKHRALQIYQRLGDQPAILKTYGNLGLIYSDAKDFARAAHYLQRVLDGAQRLAVEPETVAATHLNLGANSFWQGHYDAAITHYLSGLAVAQQARLQVLVGRAHYNLAEAYYKRFQALARADDEDCGDAHSAAALAAWPEADPAPAEATRRLKAEILGPRGDGVYDRLLPGEFAAHFSEMAEVQRHRAALALPLAEPDRIASHLAIAQAYLEIAVQEREAALALIHKHGLAPQFALSLATLRETFGREHSQAQQLQLLWRRGTGDLLSAERAAALLAHLLADGWINKSAYAQLCGTGLATASKHLGQLAERGLLQQTGKGPATRYRLPQAAPEVPATPPAASAPA